MIKYITIAADQIIKGHSVGFLGLGDHRKIINEQYELGYKFIGWVPVTFGDSTINEIDLIFEKIKE